MMLKEDSLLRDYDFIPKEKAETIEGSEKLREMNQLSYKICKYFIAKDLVTLTLPLFVYLSTYTK